MAIGSNIVVIMDNDDVPTMGAGTTGNTVPPSQLGPVGKEKLVIIADVYSENGTAKLRSTGFGIAPGSGGAEDIFRDFLGKVWVKTDSAPGNSQKLEFLNPKMGVGSSNVSLNMPCNVYVDAPHLDKDTEWPEYSQKVYIDPDPAWLYDMIIASAFPDETFSAEVKNAVVRALTNPAGAFLDLDSSVAKQAQSILGMILQWWQYAFGFDESGGTPWLADLKIEMIPQLIDYGPSYDDYSFVLSTPFSVEDATKMLGLKPLIANLDSVYNFYVHECECLLSNNKVKEQIIPNIYAFISSYIPENYGNEQHQTSKKFEDLISLNYLLQGYDGSSLVKSDPYNFAGNLIPAASNSYFTAWARTINTATPDNLLRLDPLAKKYSNILFPLNDTGMLKYYNNLRFMFPMYNDLKFSTGVLNQFGDIMRSTKLAQHFMRYYSTIGDLIKLPSSDATDLIKKTENFVIQETGQVVPPGVPPGVGASNSNSATISNEEMRVMSLDGWLATMELLDIVPDTDDLITFSVTPEMDTLFNENAVFMTTNKNEDLINVHTSNKLERSILASILFGKARKIAKSNIRHYGDLCRGKTAYSETLMYKVKKFVGSGDGIPSQTFYFLNSSEIDVLRFIDTQVSYNTRYVYKISAVQIVLGTEYRYHDNGPIFASPKASSAEEILWALQPTHEAPSQPPLGAMTGFVGEDQESPVECIENYTPSQESIYFGVKDPCGCAKFLIKYNLKTPKEAFAKGIKQCGPPTEDVGFIETGTALLTAISVVYKPKYNIVEVPYTTVEGRILDMPPVFPDVNLVPYKGINNKLLVNLNSSVGEYDMMPIAFSGEEEEEIGLLREAQKIIDEKKPIHYKSDDTVAHGGFFQIYRMEKKPQKYRDFEKHLHQTLRTKLGNEYFSLWSEAAAFVDDIKPNKKYYYTFRVVDLHGNSSNPSAVFEVEMIDDNGTVYFRQRIIELKPIEEKIPYASMRKYIQIKPTLAQRVLDEKGMDLPSATSAFEYSSEGSNGISRGTPKLGMKDESVWGKKFKIRFTSKSTGKQIDLNISFVTTGENKLEMLGNYMLNASEVVGVQTSAGGAPAADSQTKSGQPQQKTLELL